VSEPAKSRGIPTWAKVVLGLLFLPIAILWLVVSMWQRGKFPLAVRVALTAAGLYAAFIGSMVYVGAFQGITGPAPVTSASAKAPSSAENAREEDSEPASVPLPGYEIVDTEDLTFGNAVRFQYRVRVAGEPTAEELRAVVDDVVVKAKAGPAFNAISVGLYGENDDVQQAYTLGFAELAPGGDWGAADTVDAGDYDAMELVVDIY
jgi:hypothetical protein